MQPEANSATQNFPEVQNNNPEACLSVEACLKPVCDGNDHMSSTLSKDDSKDQTINVGKNVYRFILIYIYNDVFYEIYFTSIKDQFQAT